MTDSGETAKPSEITAEQREQLRLEAVWCLGVFGMAADADRPLKIDGKPHPDMQVQDMLLLDCAPMIRSAALGIYGLPEDERELRASQLRSGLQEQFVHYDDDERPERVEAPEATEA